MMIDFKSEPKHGFLYSIWSGKLKVTEGDIFPTSSKRWNKSTKQCDPLGIFMVGNERCAECCWTEGIVYNKMVWLSEKDKKLASHILIRYESDCINLLENQIDNHKANIFRLEKVGDVDAG